MKEDYERQVQKLVKLVDGATDVVDFVRVSGELVGMCMFKVSACVLCPTYMNKMASDNVKVYLCICLSLL